MCVCMGGGGGLCQDHIPKRLEKNITNLLCTIFDISN